MPANPYMREYGRRRANGLEGRTDGRWASTEPGRSVSRHHRVRNAHISSHCDHRPSAVLEGSHAHTRITMVTRTHTSTRPAPASIPPRRELETDTRPTAHPIAQTTSVGLRSGSTQPLSAGTPRQAFPGTPGSSAMLWGLLSRRSTPGGLWFHARSMTTRWCCGRSAMPATGRGR